MINAAIFDMDGTFLDSMPYWMNAGSFFLESLQIQGEENLGEKLLDMTLPEGCIYLKEKYSLNLSPEQIEEKIKNILLSAYTNEISFKGTSLSFLKKLKESGSKIAVCTHTERSLFSPAFKRLGLENFFDYVISAKEFGLSKSHPEIFFHVAEKLNSKTEETWIFEDALYAIITAKRAGFKTAGIFDSSSQKDEEKIKKIATKYFYTYSEAESFFFQKNEEF